MSSTVGHQMLPHTADVRFEAWAPTREECVAEAVVAAVETFVDVSTAEPTAEVAFQVDAAEPVDLLAAVLDELIFLMDTRDLLPLRADVRAATDGALDVRFTMTAVAQATLIGAVPKAVSLHEIAFEQNEPDRWVCLVTLDV
ncbi:archease [Tenggerimyces flavus]|uniref:Archease n=1 Tax=Tenggerimyces flavus TaxID=1708749 RepID=A0ABV7Y6I8_9ACTN|nr:archease [Tenggerimyces flavus]MBM7791089.1 SHS2 domain-containing protein [Tenggerimyces flavus]